MSQPTTPTATEASMLTVPAHELRVGDVILTPYGTAGQIARQTVTGPVRRAGRLAAFVVDGQLRSTRLFAQAVTVERAA